MTPAPVEWSLYCDAKGCGRRLLVRCSTDAAAIEALTLVAGLELWQVLGDGAHRCAEHDTRKAAWTDKPTPRAAPYHLLSAAEKRTVVLERVREPAVTCPDCDMQVMPVDLLAHLAERCAGQRAPGPSAKWLTVQEAIAMGVKRRTLEWWAERGFVRFVVAQDGYRRYLLRDLAVKIAQREGWRRR